MITAGVVLILSSVGVCGGVKIGDTVDRGSCFMTAKISGGKSGDLAFSSSILISLQDDDDEFIDILIPLASRQCFTLVLNNFPPSTILATVHSLLSLANCLSLITYCPFCLHLTRQVNTQSTEALCSLFRSCSITEVADLYPLLVILFLIGQGIYAFVGSPNDTTDT